MPSVNKTRRLIQILTRLQNGHIYNSTQLANFCGVSTRTLYRYLRELQDAGVPILHDDERQGYWLTSHESVAPMRLNPQEVLSMVLLCEHGGSSDKGIPFLDSAAHVSQFILNQLSDSVRRRVASLASMIDIQLHCPTKSGLNRKAFDQVLTALDQKHRLRVHVQTTDTHKDLCTLLSPYKLLFQSDTWHIVGRSSWHRKVVTLSLATIKRTEPTSDKYIIPSRFSIQNFQASEN